MKKLAALSAAAVLAVAGCSSPEPDDAPATPDAVTEAPATEAPETPTASEPPTEPVDPTPADINFAQMMVGHHEQAIILVDIAFERSSNAELLELAEEISAAQGPEIELMRSWVIEWGYEPLEYEDHKDHEMPGMLTDEELAEIEDAPAEDFDRLWLEGMIEHHEGAILMAEDQLRDGVVPYVSELSEEIIEVQDAEIEYMREMIERL